MCLRLLRHVVNASGLSWNAGDMDFTGGQMVLTLKLISMAVCFQDAHSKGKDEDEKEVRKRGCMHVCTWGQRQGCCMMEGCTVIIWMMFITMMRRSARNQDVVTADSVTDRWAAVGGISWGAEAGSLQAGVLLGKQQFVCPDASLGKRSASSCCSVMGSSQHRS
jgi:hypothetical protein